MRSYAIVIDLDPRALESLEDPLKPRDCVAAHGLIGETLLKYGFRPHRQGVYFGGNNATPVHCVLATQQTVLRCPWLPKVVFDIRMLRIEEETDLMPAVEALRAKTATLFTRNSVLDA